jgi:hypothetical protein
LRKEIKLGSVSAVKNYTFKRAMDLPVIWANKKGTLMNAVCFGVNVGCS